MIIIMLGAQGTGKGTVAGLISGETGMPQISTGDIFRKAISEKTAVGIEAEKYISKGMLVPDENDIEETEVIESNVFAGKAGLFTGKLTIDNVRVYWEYDCNDFVAEPDEYDEYYDR